MKEILKYAKDNFGIFEHGSVSSNEIRYFEYENNKYIMKKPLMVGERLSPFWLMMKNVFNFTFEKQNAQLQNVYNELKNNPHISVSPFVIADEDVMIYEYVEGSSFPAEKFPAGKANAYRLGQYVGYNHQKVHKNCGLIGIEDVTDFFSAAVSHMENCISVNWNSQEIVDKKMRDFFCMLRERRFESSKYSLIMIDICADQFLYEGEDLAACVDLDAYVIGPVEWEISFLKNQVEDWESFKAGYETYQIMPEYNELSDFFYFIMALNLYNNKREVDEICFNSIISD